VADQQNGRIQIWMNDSIYPTRTIIGSLVQPLSIFVTINGDIYVSSRNETGLVVKWTSNSNTSVRVMNVGSACNGLFVGIDGTLYCSMMDNHKVVKKLLNNSTNTSTLVAGTGTKGFASNMLDNPIGIFVDINFDLYVSDSGNHRIQLFVSGQLIGTTVADSRSPIATMTLNDPSTIILDADKYLFIVDRGNHRIVRSGPNGFRCLVGCSGSAGSASNQLNKPRGLSFDSFGNMFVTDMNNNRIQKFLLSTSSCGE
jgi:sugar lactone lactonase YvrE